MSRSASQWPSLSLSNRPRTHNGRLGPHWAPIHVYTGHWSGAALFELGSLNASSGTPLSNSNCPSRLWGWIKREIFIW